LNIPLQDILKTYQLKIVFVETDIYCDNYFLHVNQTIVFLKLQMGEEYKNSTLLVFGVQILSTDYELFQKKLN